MSNQQFLDGPFVFANAHTLVPFADQVVNQNQMKILALANGSSFTQVQGENKVAWCNIQPASDFPGGIGVDGAGNYKDDTNLLIMRVTYQQSGTAFPVYYLPWAPDSMFRMKLKPSSKNPTQTGIFFKDTVEPTVFITAALQGCSIIVSGDPQEPVVYHLNAQTTQGPLGEDLGSNNDSDFTAAANAKRLQMLGSYNMARAQFPKEGQRALGMRPQQNFTSQSAHLTDYMHSMLPSRRTALGQQYLGALGGSVAQFGTVFGFKDNGGWKFYRQTRTRVFHFGPRIGTSNRFADTSTWVNPVCVRFWP